MVLAIDSRLESIALLNSTSFGFFDEARFITTSVGATVLGAEVGNVSQDLNDQRSYRWALK
jgi:hypothetical protein